MSKEKDEPITWLYAAVVMSVFVVMMAAVGALIAVCRYNKTKQESPLNNRNVQYSNVGKDVENNPNMHSVIHNVMPLSRQIQITSNQGKQESKSTKTTNIISLNSEKAFIEELLPFIPTAVYKFEVLDPADIVVKAPIGYSFEDHKLENRINIIVLNNIVVRDMLGNSETNEEITNILIIFINRIMKDKDLFLHTYFIVFEEDLELFILNFDNLNIFSGILPKLVALSGTVKGRINKFVNFMNRIEIQSNESNHSTKKWEIG